MTNDPPTARLIPLPLAALEALIDGALDRASAVTGVALPPLFLEEIRFWRIRRDDLRANPAFAPWAERAVFGRPADAVVGHAGFHDPPNATGTVEVGYGILPDYRRQGYGRAALAELLRFAAASPEVRTVRASISPDNVASLALARSCGFRQVGEQWDDEDGRELVFERAARA
jgi:[ribosomal protein S5]-alanine N-acetyltransferase